jgi:hypothetical protein
MADIPNTRFINFVDAPVTVSYTAGGFGQVNLDPQTGGVIDLTGFRTFSVKIDTTKATSFAVVIGKVSGATLADSLSQPVDNKIHTYNVTGPQMVLNFTGPPNTHEKVKLWVYLRS